MMGIYIIGWQTGIYTEYSYPEYGGYKHQAA